MMLRIFGLIGMLALLPTHPANAEADFTAGIDYEVIAPPITASEPGKVEVIEFFWYGCPHCYGFEPYVQKWLANKPDNVTFTRVPAIFGNPRWEIHARAYYTAEVLGVLDQIHQPLFDAIHKDKKRLYTREALRDFFAERGVEAAKFDKTFDSFAVESKVRRARDLSQRSGITGVPATVIDGRFRVGASQAATYKNLIAITDHVARKVLAGGAE